MIKQIGRVAPIRSDFLLASAADRVTVFYEVKCDMVILTLCGILSWIIVKPLTVSSLLGRLIYFVVFGAEQCKWKNRGRVV